MADTLELVSINNQLAIDVKREEVKNVIIERITKLGLSKINYKLDAEFLLLVANMVEHLVVNTKHMRIDKKGLVIDIIHSMFALSAVEKVSIESNIEFLHSNKNIKKVSAFKLFCVGLRELFGYKKK
jgi:hypothetical protein